MQSGTGASLGRLNVPAETMAGHCLTMVSPQYPQTGAPLKPSTVVVRVVISKSGTVAPVRVVSGEPSLETEAMNAVRLWRYKPFMRDDEPIDVNTDIRVDFDPAKRGGIVTHPNR
jgi:periplasmic protein TonB